MAGSEAPKFVSHEASLYSGMKVRKYEDGPLLYQLEGVRGDDESLLGMIVLRTGNVYLTLEEQERRGGGLSIEFRSSAQGSTHTPHMAERLARIPRTFLEKEGRMLDDEPDCQVTALQEQLKVLPPSSASQGMVMGLVGDGDHGTTMTLGISGGGDMGVTLIQTPTPILPFRRIDITFAASSGGTFHSGIWHEFREAAREIIASRSQGQTGA